MSGKGVLRKGMILLHRMNYCIYSSRSRHDNTYRPSLALSKYCLESSLEPGSMGAIQYVMISAVTPIIQGMYVLHLIGSKRSEQAMLSLIINFFGACLIG